MAIVLTDDTHYKNIAGTLRELADSSDTYYPEDMADGIREVYGDSYNNGYKEANNIFIGNFAEGHGITGDLYSDKCTNIAQSAFENAEMSSVDFPNVTIVRDLAFCYCYSLKSANLPKAETISYSAFDSCFELHSIDIQSCQILDESAFSSCGSLKTIDLPKIANINDYAFIYSGLETLILRPNKVISLVASTVLLETPIDLGDGFIYVPRTRVDEYKSATNWSRFADQIRAIEDYPYITGG